ncbi:MAG TPA: protein tyrosine phosphatase [Patescibacteria group bacterium]|nr:protein tyrosine phosphatase [Patescibacteria group bacterium]
MKKWFWSMVMTLLLAMSSGTVLAADSPDLQLRLDVMDEGEKLPSAFRMIPDLQASGSREFSSGGLRAIKAALPDTPVIIVDLREESHGFADGTAISWYGYRNWANLGKRQDEIVRQEQDQLAALTKTAAVTMISDVKHKNGKTGEAEQGAVTRHVQSALTEEELAKSLDLGYYRITVTDHRGPVDSKVDQFITFVNALPPDVWLHFHCEAGHGRTTTFMAMYDMMRNGKTVGLTDIIARQHQAGGVNLFSDDETGWQEPYAEERAEFLQRFYEYCSQNQDGFRTSWTQWRNRVDNEEKRDAL